VRWWTTLNEPFIVAEQGHLLGAHAPGIRNVYAACHAVHNQLRAHAEAARVIKASVPGASVGIAMHNSGVVPASSSADDVAAAEVAHAWQNFPLFLEPLVHGRYPAAVEPLISPYLPDAYKDDMADIQGAPDFAGMNYYSGYLARRDDAHWLGFGSVDEPEAPRTAMNWIIRPEGIHSILTRAHEAYELPLFVTENGAAFDDARQGGSVDDPDRVAYLDSHIRAVLQARDEGVPIEGYFAWSLLDNYEWACGYEKRFGLVYVDFETQERIVKSSGRWYGRLARDGHLVS
jgi:beta-glucosidase